METDRAIEPLRVTSEVKDRAGHSPQQIEQMKKHLARMNEEGTGTIIE